MSAPALNLNLDPQAGPPGRSGHSVARVAAQPATSARKVYLALLTWAFTLFNSVRVFSYLPTLWAIHASGDSSQHSLVTWLTWLGANVTMALWLYEHNGQRFNRAVMVNAGNAAMCLVTSLLIAWHRL
jgi:hypothetical protein